MNSRKSQQRPTRRSSESAKRIGRPDEVQRSEGVQRRVASDPSAYGQPGNRSGGDPSSPGSSAQGLGSDRDSAYGRRVTQAEYAQRRKRAKRKRIALIAVAIALVVCLGGAGAAFAYYQSLSSSLHDGIDPALAELLRNADNGKPYEGGPFYMLLMGTDGSSDREASEEYAGDQFRSDSMMLVRVDPQGKKVAMVSLHRDTLVDMGEYGQNKLNAAHAFGGAAFTVETVSKMAGVPITHYAEINFDGFKDIVDALGGVEVDVPMEIDDEDAGGQVDQGLQTLSGDQALILCRARHAYDEFGDGDRYRAANQRLVLSAIAKKLLSSDLATMANTVSALANYVTTDFEIADILSIAQSMRGLDPEKDIYTAMEPTTSSYVDGGWYEYLDKQAWKTMMERVEQGLSPTEEALVDEASGTVLATTGEGGAEQGTAPGGAATSKGPAKVTVQNGNGTVGASSVAAEQLEAQGYQVDTGNADNFDYAQTIVVFKRDDQENEAKKIANALGVGKAQLDDGRYTFDGDFLVVLGSDW
ncbi:MAG: LCP family protein [Gordonibacter sp.]|uniref:LCP family protein n=1 Tax=Gordonibacter sp. TaxID=1968902 RepID=UPI002FC8AEB9